MRKILFACLAAFAAVSLAAPDPADAARRKKKVTVTSPPTATFYFTGNGAYGLYDNSRQFHGSPVRGFEFFRQNADRATQ